VSVHAAVLYFYMCDAQDWCIALLRFNIIFAR